MYILTRTWKHKQLPPCIKTLCWRLIRRTLATRERAGKYSNKISKLCSTCNIVENDSHLFIHCTFARAVWFSANPPFCTSMLPVEQDGVKEILPHFINQNTTDEQIRGILTTLAYGRPEMTFVFKTKIGLSGNYIMKWRLTSRPLRYLLADMKNRCNRGYNKMTSHSTNVTIY